MCRSCNPFWEIQMYIVSWYYFAEEPFYSETGDTMLKKLNILCRKVYVKENIGSVVSDCKISSEEFQGNNFQSGCYMPMLELLNVSLSFSPCLIFFA